MEIPFVVGQAADVSVGPVNASATVAAGGSGGKSVFSGLVVSPKGKPFTLQYVTKKDWQQKLGTPLRANTGKLSQSLRCLSEAVNGGDGYIVRVVPSTAKYPVLMLKDVDADSGLNVTQATALSFSEKPDLTANTAHLGFYIVDGSTQPRSITLTRNSDDITRYTLTIHVTSELGTESVENSFECSMAEMLDDDGMSLYIPDVLERKNSSIRCVVASTATSSNIVGFAKTPFIGATNGADSDLVAADWDKALAVLSNAMVGYTAVVGLGITDTAILEKLVQVADSRRIDMFADIEATSWATAISYMQGASFNHERLSMYFYPYMANDPFYKGSKAHWGISGIAFCAKAKGVMQVMGSTGGWHLSPAGVDRGVISRKSPMPFDGLDTPDYEQLVKHRINKIGITPNGLLMIDDALTTRVKNDYLRFQHVSSTLDAISRDFYAMAKLIQHEPDGITFDSLDRGMKEICGNYVASGALVKPRDPEDGDSPYKYEITQDEFDLWSVRWWVCVTGTSRRIQGFPALLK